MGKPDWAAIEKDCLKTGLSYAQLAEKYGVSVAALKKQASRKGWGKKKSGREQIKKRVEEALTEMSPEKMSPEYVTTGDKVTILPKESDAERFNRIVDEMMDRIEDAICCMDVRQPGAVKLMTGALKDLRDLKGLNKTALDIEEQKARIEKLRFDTQIHENSNEQIVVEFVNTEGAEA